MPSEIGAIVPRIFFQPFIYDFKEIDLDPSTWPTASSYNTSGWPSWHPLTVSELPLISAFDTEAPAPVRLRLSMIFSENRETTFRDRALVNPMTMFRPRRGYWA